MSGSQAALDHANLGHNAPYNVEAVRADFPILATEVHGKPLVYLDNAASAQKPRSVIDAETGCYERTYSNVHRGAHFLSAAATDLFEESREATRRFINAADTREIIFTRGATEAINLVASSWGRANIQPGDEIIISAMEHHANIVPWHFLREEKGAVLKVAPISDAGDFLLEEFEKLVTPRTKMVAMTHMSNALGTIVPMTDVIRIARSVGAKILVDGCQAICHSRIDVQALDVDFYVFSGHKIYGPSGIGVLYGKRDLLEAMPPYQGGGEMIATVTFDRITYADLPHKFEAGTPAIAQAIALKPAIEYIAALGIENIGDHEHDLLAYATEQMTAIDGVHIVGTARNKASILSFVMDDAHPHDLATILDRSGVAVRSGHHCAQPLMDRFDVPATARASFGLYNTRAEVDALIAAIHKAKDIFG